MNSGRRQTGEELPADGPAEGESTEEETGGEQADDGYANDEPQGED